MNGIKKSLFFQKDLVAWLRKVSKREGFATFSQTVNWIIRKAMEADKSE
jgi:hypothetical protein